MAPAFFFGVFLLKNVVFRMFLVIYRPQGQKVGAFWSKSDQNRKKSEINVPKQGLTSKTRSKMYRYIRGGEGTYPPPKAGVILGLGHWGSLIPSA